MIKSRDTIIKAVNEYSARPVPIDDMLEKDLFNLPEPNGNEYTIAEIKRIITQHTSSIYKIGNAYDTTDGDVKQFFHLAKARDIRRFNRECLSYISMFKQPSWCAMENALDPFFGCNSLLDIFGKRLKISADYCRKCESFRIMKDTEYLRILRLLCGIQKDDLNRYLKIQDYEKVESMQRPVTLKEVESLASLYGMKVEDIVLGSYAIKNIFNIKELNNIDALCVSNFRKAVRNKIYKNEEKQKVRTSGWNKR